MTSRFNFGGAVCGIMAALMVSQSASALSCARPDLVRTLEDAKASPKIYHVLVGRFISRGSPKHNPGGYVSPEEQFKPKPPVITQSLFEGVSLAQTPRQDHQLTRFPVDIETSCIGPWCSSAPQSDQELIAFVEARPGQSPILRISPCPSQAFRADPKQVSKVRQCLDQTCEPEAPNRGFRR